MNEFSTVTLIGRPVEDVFAALTDITRTPMWTPGLSEARQASEGPLESGATLVYAGTFLGRRYESTVVCIDLAANKRFATRTTAGPFDLEVDITIRRECGIHAVPAT